MIAVKMLRDICPQKTVSEVEFGFVPHIQNDDVRHQSWDFNWIYGLAAGQAMFRAFGNPVSVTVLDDTRPKVEFRAVATRQIVYHGDFFLLCPTYRRTAMAYAYNVMQSP